MKNIIITISLLLSINSFAEKVEIDGKLYPVKERSSKVECGNFSIISTTKKLPDFLHHSKIPKSLSIGHKGINYIGYELTYQAEGKLVKVKPLESYLNGYERIAEDRLYISRPQKCIQPNTVLFSMWGGGNCSDVCEAFSLITFNPNGEIEKAEGLSMKEYKDLKK